MRRDVFQAIADPTRRGIIALISKKPLTLNTIAENFEVSRPAISQHMKILFECGLVTIRQEGRERYCEAKLKPLAAVADWLDPYRKMMTEKYDRLDEVLARMQAPRKTAKKK